MKSILKADAIWTNAISILRISVGIIFIWYRLNFYDITKMNAFATFLQVYHISFPLISAYILKTVEFFGGLFLMAKLFTRIARLFMIINMTVNTNETNRKHPFNLPLILQFFRN